MLANQYIKHLAKENMNSSCVKQIWYFVIQMTPAYHNMSVVKVNKSHASKKRSTHSEISLPTKRILMCAYTLWYNEVGWQVVMDEEPGMVEIVKVARKSLNLWKIMGVKEREWWVGKAFANCQRKMM